MLLTCRKQAKKLQNVEKWKSKMVDWWCIRRLKVSSWKVTSKSLYSALRHCWLPLGFGYRDCHGFEKPAGKCHGLTWGAGMGWVYPTLTKPIPAATGWRVTWRIQTPLEDLINCLQAHQSLLPTFITTHCVMLEPWKHNKKVSQRTQLLISYKWLTYLQQIFHLHCSRMPAHTLLWHHHIASPLERRM